MGLPGWLEARRDLVVTAACLWRAAVRAQEANPGARTDHVEAEQRQRLLDAVAAYLSDEEPGR